MVGSNLSALINNYDDARDDVRKCGEVLLEEAILHGWRNSEKNQDHRVLRSYLMGVLWGRKNK